jgi:hypothetical protein
MKSILQHIGGFLKKVFTAGEKVADEGEKLAQVAEPIVDIAFPGIAVLYNFTVQQVAVAQAAADGASGAGKQKLAAVLAAVAPFAEAELAKLGVPKPTVDQITNYVNAVVASLNALPAPVAPAA